MQRMSYHQFSVHIRYTYSLQNGTERVSGIMSQVAHTQLFLEYIPVIGKKLRILHLTAQTIWVKVFAVWIIELTEYRVNPLMDWNDPVATCFRFYATYKIPFVKMDVGIFKLQKFGATKTSINEQQRDLSSFTIRIPQQGNNYI